MEEDNKGFQSCGSTDSIDNLLADLTGNMSSPSIQRSGRYEELVKKQLSFTEDINGDNSCFNPINCSTKSPSGSREGLFDEPLTEERHKGMRDVQITLERLDSKHGVLTRHASAECVRPADNDNDYLKRTSSDTIPVNPSPMGAESSGAQEKPPSRQPSERASVSSSSTQRTSASHPRSERQSPSELRNHSERKSQSDRVSQTSRQTPSDRTSPSDQQRLGLCQQQSDASSSQDGASLSDKQSASQSETVTKIPVLSPLTTNRTTPLTASPPTGSEGHRPVKVTATSSSRTVPSKQLNGESAERTVSLRQLLVESKLETSELRRLVDELQIENKRLREQQSQQPNGPLSEPASSLHNQLSSTERRCDELLREKENLATELWKLRQQVDDLHKQETQLEIPSDKLQTYRSDKPDVLWRKINDLESQIQDLQEANETASAEVLRLDQENQMLTAELNRLRSGSRQDIENEQRALRQQLEDLKNARDRSMMREDEVLHLRSEIAQLRIDHKAAQEKAVILVEENAQLRETVRELKCGDRWAIHEAINAEPEVSRTGKEAAWDEINNLKQKIKEYTSRSASLPHLRSPERVRNYYSSTQGLSAYDKGNSFESSHRAYQPLDTAGSTNLKTHRPNVTRLEEGLEFRPPSPSSRSDISESTTALMLGYDGYKTEQRSFAPPKYDLSARTASPPLPLIEDDVTSECTMDILNEASFSSRGVLPFSLGNEVQHDSVIPSKASPHYEDPKAIKSNGFYGNHIRRNSLDSSSAHSESTQERLDPPATFGLRSVISPILPTQHNKNNVSPVKLTLNTAGRRPFAPRAPADLNIGDVAKFARPDGKICRGLVKFVGNLHDKNDTFIGLELEYQEGKHDGVYDGVRYFDCKHNRGAFVSFNKLIMVWGS